MMPLLERTTQLERVELRPRLVPREKIMNGVEYVETGRGHGGSVPAVYNDRSIMSYFRSAVDSLRAYEPGEQPSPDDDVIKLNTNENPYPPSPRAMAALRDIDPEHLRRYPDSFAAEFRTSAADVLGVDPDWILVGNGSDDILTMLMRSVADTRRAVAYPVPTYALYRTLAHIQDAPVVEVGFGDNYDLPVDALVQTGAALTLVASPNSPSGNRIPNDMMSDLASRLDGLLAIDEAYVDFATGNALELARRHENVLVLRTLSKGQALAGLRLGFAVASPVLIAGLAKVKDSYNVDAISARVGAVAYRDVDHSREMAARVCASRQRLAAALTKLGFRVWPSEANFLLVRPADGRARALYQSLKASRILVRYFDTPGLDDKLRITVGSDTQNDRLVVVLAEQLRPPHHP